MREFRGKRVDNGERIYGWYAEDINGNPTIYPFDKPAFCYEVIPETVGQFVCIDRDGKKVFSGDKVIASIFPYLDDHEGEGVVTYRPEFADYVLVKDGFDVDEGYGNYGIKSKDIKLIEAKQ